MDPQLPAPPQQQQQPRQQQGSPQRVLRLAHLRAAMHGPFEVAEVVAAAERVKVRKAAAGCLPPWLLRPAATQLAPALTAQFSAWRRVGRLAAAECGRIITPIPKGTAPPASCADLRGIAVGTLSARVYAAVLERRVSDWAEAAGIRSEGQFGFRRRRGTSHAAFVLRTLQEQARLLGGELWACFVDFKQAYDRVRRDLLWAKLEARGLGGEWQAAVRALYAEVPMSVRTEEGLAECFLATLGLLQGCPLSPTLFGLYIDDFEEWLWTAAAGGARLDSPLLAGLAVWVLLYADDMALVATSAAGLQAQLDLLAAYCERWDITVNAIKTKLMLLAGARSATAAVRAAAAAGLTFAGESLEAVSSFRYLGIVFEAARPLAGSAAPARTAAARAALAACNSRCAALGVVAARVRMRLFSTMVDSVLSHGAEVWAVQLVAAAAAGGSQGGSCSSGSAAEALHVGHLRRLLGVRQATPTGAVLLETGERPLWVRWLVRAGKLWNRLVAEPQGGLLQRAFAANLQLAAWVTADVPPGRRPWAAQLAAALAAVGMPVDLQSPRPLCVAQLRRQALGQHLQEISAAAARPGATKLAHYLATAWGGQLPPAEEYIPAPVAYLAAVRQRVRRVALAQLRTGSHWLAEETGRWEGRPRALRTCPHCHAGVEDVPHVLFVCPLYGQVRARFPDLFSMPAPSAHEFMQQNPVLLAALAAECQRVHAAAATTGEAAAAGGGGAG